MNPLLDKNFLYELNQFRQKEIYARIIALNFDEYPLEQIEGKVTGGSLNIDGSSAVRRTCNLSLVAKDVNISDFYWSVSNKFILEIGLKNQINANYPEIIWFHQGLFVITSFNVSLTNNSYNISISGKDKMCLLNGDLGGNLSASVDFGKIDTYTNSYEVVKFENTSTFEANKYYSYNGKEYVIETDEYDAEKTYYKKNTLLIQEDLKLKDIIREAVHVYGKEMYHNIVINDLDNYGLELLEYRGDSPLYLLYNEDLALYDNMVLIHDGFNVYKELSKESWSYEEYYINQEDFYNKSFDLFVYNENEKIYTLASKNYNAEETYFIKKYNYPVIDEVPTPLNEIPILNNAISSFNDERTIFYLEKELDFDGLNRSTQRYSLTKIESGETAGYRTTDLVYPGDLISSIGETLTSILDKIKNLLGPFEYFYDKNGRFIFQAKKIYANESWNTLQDSDDNIFARDAVEESPYSYSFEDMNLIQSFRNTPAINQIKNDYSIWGVRKSVNGGEIPIHARYAIHKKPEFYKSFEDIIYCQNTKFIEDFFANRKKSLIVELNNRINSFVPQYTLPSQLEAPKRLADKTWSSGWWDIRDWFNYCSLLNGNDFSIGLKWYSQNNKDGCVLYKDLFHTADQTSNSAAWILVYNPQRQTWSRPYGISPYSPVEGSWGLKWYSEYNENNELISYWLDKDGNKNEQEHRLFLMGSEYITNHSEEAKNYIIQQLNINDSELQWFDKPYSLIDDDLTYFSLLEKEIKNN